MNNIKIITDTAADLPEKFLEEYDVETVSLGYFIDGNSYNKNNPMDVKEFYTKMRNGSMPTTSQVNIEDVKNAIICAAKETSEILCLAFSSGLSGTYNSTAVAANEVLEENPQLHIRVVDTLCASLGQGLLVYYAVKMREAGKSLNEIADYMEQHCLDFIHLVTVDDLNHLYRGGRINKATAIVGSLANIKPLIHVDEEGHLVNFGKARGRKKSLSELVNLMEVKMGNKKNVNETVFISHGDCLEDAQYVANEIEKRFGIHNIMINEIGPTVGAHAGPGTVALFFVGETR